MTLAVLLMLAGGSFSLQSDDEQVAFSLSMVGDDARMDGSTIQGPLEADESFDYNLFAAMPSLRYSQSRFGGRMVAGLSYLGRYRGRLEDDDTYFIGSQVIPELGYERFFKLKTRFKDVDYPIGAWLGLPITFPRGDLRDDLTEIEDLGATRLPKLGGSVGLHAGARKRLNDKFSLRLRASVERGWLYLISNRARVDGIDFQRRWRGQVVRAAFGAQVEMNL